MSVHLLDVLPTDVSADALGLVLDAPVPETLVELRLHDADAGELTLGIIGASHVVTAAAADGTLTEQVSCDAVRSGGRRLPALEERRGYRFTSRTERVGADELRHRAQQLREQSALGNWLCAAFPGDGDALTVLTGLADAGEWRWRTWHLYPGAADGVIVETESRWRP
ncbi:DUF2617 domain-containing protein [Prescottella defluvii]|uniref:DUF2617 family protein n=1 Tax=Prescottella defluvii TaxID=1323361 RepID=UPI0004F3AAF3|nr:DUF2617 family protein [Prescottella defluvii]